MGKKLDKVLEGYKPIPMKRMLYPRGMKLSDDFVNAFHREFDRLVDEGANPKSLVERFGKALRFHQNEERRYHKLDEEKGDHREDETPEAYEKDPSADFPYKKKKKLEPSGDLGDPKKRFICQVCQGEGCKHCDGKGWHSKNIEEAKNKKPDKDGDGVPDWADKKPGKDDHHKSSAKGTEKHKKRHK